ncbi:MAG: hypothetical protein BGN92_09800 [Sphingobacteriales bacterium 41-5]|nr:MAG: hypothetical protein BGN92_09800 [Sphingobacteriales bacterium 41-5]
MQEKLKVYAYQVNQITRTLSMIPADLLEEAIKEVNKSDQDFKQDISDRLRTYTPLLNIISNFLMCIPRELHSSVLIEAQNKNMAYAHGTAEAMEEIEADAKEAVNQMKF